MLRVVMARVAHGNALEVPLQSPVRACPYCAHRAPGEGWLWAAFTKELEQLSGLLEEHLRYEQLMHVRRTLGQNPKPTFVPVLPRPLPPRLRADPLGHFAKVELLCCGAEVKLRPPEGARITCPSCGVRQGQERSPEAPNLPAPDAIM
jgi:DNA-directed RNA polymerase subunit RPC12/RpoP